MRVSDGGRGLPVSGRRDLAALEQGGVGPRTLKERACSLGGTLIVMSSSGGASVEMRLPVQEEG